MDFEHFFNTPPVASGDQEITVSTAVRHLSRGWVDLENAATFDVTGGALEDLWTSTAHGLAVGDTVQFRAVGTGAEPYAVDTTYYVVNVNDANTFQLSATSGGAVLEGTGTDSAGTWTPQKGVAASAAEIHVTGNPVRVRFGADPAGGGAGILVPVGESLKLSDGELADVRMIRDTASDGTAFVVVFT